MNGKSGFLQRLRDGLVDLVHRPMAHHQGVRRWTVLGTTGILSIVFLGVSGLALGTLGSGIGVTVSSNPSFCGSCHEIQPAYEQWRISSHENVNCLACHADAGLAGYQKITFDGLGNISAHLGGGVDLPAEAIVKNESCLACHARDSLPETMPEATLKIAHSLHEDQSCTTCHVRLVHPRLFEEPEAKTPVVNQGPKDCTVCHSNPEPSYLHGDAQVSCSSCHSGSIPNHDVAVRRNTPLQETCTSCHTAQRVSQKESCQTCHVSPHGVELSCTQCHSSDQSWGTRKFDHPVAIKGAHDQLKCTQCHAPSEALPPPAASRAVPVQTLSTGKYLCSTCHTPKHAPMDQNCTMCHSPTQWKPLKGQTK